LINNNTRILGPSANGDYLLSWLTSACYRPAIVEGLHQSPYGIWLDGGFQGDYYNTEKLIKDLGLPVEKIDACTSRPKAVTDAGRSPCMLSLGTCRLLPVCRGSIFFYQAHDVACIIDRGGVDVSSTMPRRGSILTGLRSYLFILARYRYTRLIDVYLEPLTEELLQLWYVGVRMYEQATDNAFIMRAALMWTVNDLPACGMASRWSIARVMRCPVLYG
ncbi:hypothetical protein Sango_3104500, partial [Sesamum angolense]